MPRRPREIEIECIRSEKVPWKWLFCSDLNKHSFDMVCSHWSNVIMLGERIAIVLCALNDVFASASGSSDHLANLRI